MDHGNELDKSEMGAEQRSERSVQLSPAWMAFIRYCQKLRHGEIERLKIQDGLPMIAELAVKKIKFAP
ncbi:MAG TPA: hypothetical protein VFI95_17710 [Terriglobales bacterium]|nr:hypothetical protein [Terriglobales bacterium]